MKIESIRLKNFKTFRDVHLSDIPPFLVVVGANGAGKSTLLQSLFRETNIISGEIWVHDTRIDRMPGYMAAKLGISISPQGRRILPNLTVLRDSAAKANERQGALVLDGLEFANGVTLALVVALAAAGLFMAWTRTALPRLLRDMALLLRHCRQGGAASG